MSKRRKVVLFLVEGITDVTTLALPLRKLYGADPQVEFRVIHGDITAQEDVSIKNILERVGGELNLYAKSQKLKKDDFVGLVHIVDTDGAFVSDEQVKEDLSREKPFYREDGIYTSVVKSIQERNHRKAQVIKKLLETHNIGKCPYRLYYMSCNLEHALYGDANADNKQKTSWAEKFEKEYKNDPEALIERFHSIYPEGILEEYSASWAYIQQDNHSLESGSNLYLEIRNHEGDFERLK